MERLDSMLRAINPFIECYLQMHRIIEENPATNIRMGFMENGDLDLRRCNQPTSKTEIAAIFVGDNGEPPANRDICVYPVDTYSKIRTKDDIDKYVSSELPDPIADTALFQIITICMIHGPCGTLNPNSSSMRESVCTKQYPKEFREKTEENINGYPMYQRKCTESLIVGRHDLDNRWVVPYNPWLSKKFSAHINVEVCVSIKCVKHLYKSVYKGHDAASIRFENENTLDHDEILSFLDGRYVNAPEAMWRLNEFSLSERSHTVVRLTVHLRDQQAIVYQDGQEEGAVAKVATRQTTLTAWFKLNKNDQDCHNYLYTDIPHYYTFNKNAMKWQKRQRGGEQVMGRMPLVNIQDYERGKGHHVTPVAATGIAATLLNGGRTAHSVFKIPIVLNATSTCNMKPNTQEDKLICETKLIIWDEVPMTHAHAFIAVDRLLQDLANCSLPFGGKVILLGGDFRQVLPVVLKGSRSLTVDSCLKKHNLGSKFNKKTWEP
ncbi:hypothetical protein AVEN_233058-1 [Araneus ventricosus]|uniref:ATP-dependent DNA helicase n=1 Tax=Araneus ventricosus TaxID=182803 RepID=A0A4Y2V2G8_ARAVE|nr:hypothetical protein AVEN_21032-1 [Araneus ventricosus]GBO17947.1 hypothetical protein AVEN_233058-1 [Araneus ventricosus]